MRNVFESAKKNNIDNDNCIPSTSTQISNFNGHKKIISYQQNYHSNCRFQPYKLKQQRFNTITTFDNYEIEKNEKIVSTPKEMRIFDPFPLHSIKENYFKIFLRIILRINQTVKLYTRRKFSSTIFSLSFLSIIKLLSFFAFIIVQPSSAQSSGRCYSFAPGITIHGADYRRDYNTNKQTCAEVCRYDACCMAYEWRKTDGICTLKSRSLNDTVQTINGSDVYFGLCIDYDDTERDRFWDHVVDGVIVASFPHVSRNKCSDLCLEANNNSSLRTKRLIGRWRRNETRSPKNTSKRAVMYSWETVDERNTEFAMGNCNCIGVVESIKISFGSFSGFLV